MTDEARAEVVARILTDEAVPITIERSFKDGKLHLTINGEEYGASYRLSRLLTGTTAEPTYGIFDNGPSVTVGVSGKNRTFTFTSLDLLFDTREEIIEKLTERVHAVRAWTRALEFETETFTFRL